MLAGRMKLNHFLLLALLAGAGGLTGAYYACSGSGEPRDAAITTAQVPQNARPPGPETGRSEGSGGPSRGVETALATAPDRAGAPNTRRVDSDVMKWAGKALGSSKKKDITAGKPYKVNLYQDAGNATLNRAKVDLDRDDKWDEKWTFDGDRITRKVAPADDENYTESYIWTGSEWSRQ